MGWLWTHKPRHIKPLDFIINHTGALTWSSPQREHNYKVIDAALVGLRTAYFAVEQVHRGTGERRVWAAIFLLGYAPKNRHNFGWKDMDETCGPYEASCPERILKLLTPTDNQYANDWRQRCWEKIERRRALPKVVKGAVIVYRGRRYTAETRLHRSWLVRGDDHTVYGLSDVRMREATEIILPKEAEHGSPA